MRKSVISFVLSAALVCSLMPVDGVGRKASAAVGGISAVETLMAGTTLGIQSDKKAAGEVAAGADAVPASGTEEKYATSGTCGDNAEWFINSDATLVVHGSGILQKEDQFGSWPWAPFAKDIQRVIVEDGITALGAGIFQRSAFSDCESLTEAVFASTVSDLKSCLSGSMSELKDIWVYSPDMENTFSGSGSSYPAAGSGTKWHIYEGSTTEKSLRDGLKLTDEDIEYIPENQRFPAVDDRTPVKLPEDTDTSGISGLLSKWKWDDQSKTLTFSGKGVISISEGYYEKYKEAAEHIVIESGITSVDASTGVVALETTGAFYGYTVLEDAELPDTLKKIGDGTFRETPLSQIINGLPESLEAIGNLVFKNTSLSGDLILPQTLKTIGREGFSGTDITSVTLHEGMDLGGSCFSNCDSIRELTIPGGIYYGGSQRSNGSGPGATFSGCDSLEKVIIEGVGRAMHGSSGTYDNSLPGRMFANCPSLKEIRMEAENLAHVEALGWETSGGAQNSGIFDMENSLTVKLYKGSTTEATLAAAGYLTAENTEYLPVDTTALAEAVARAEGIDTAKYTEESAGALDAALTDAKEILGQEYPLPSAVKAAAAALEEAIAALEEKSTSPGGDSTPAPDGSGDDSGNGDGGTAQPSPTPGGNGDDSGNGNGSTTQPSPTPGGNGDGSTVQPSPTPGGGTAQPTTPPNGSTAEERAAKDKAAAEKAMAQAKISKLTAKSKAKKKLKVSWKKAGKATGCEVQVSQKKNFKKKLFDKFTAKRTLTFNKKLKSKKIYYVRVRAYADYKDAGGVTRKVYSKWSKKCKVKIK